MPEWLPPIAPALAEPLGRFQPLRPIETNGPKLVYLARGRHPDRQVVIKLLREDAGVSEEIRTHHRQALIRTGMTLTRLRHPGVVQLYEFGGIADDVFLALEYLDGGNLDQMFSAFGHLLPGDLLPIAAHIAGVLDYLHKIGVVHCDVHPGRILLDGRGGCRLTGFSLARAPDPTSAGISASLPVSIKFAAPELLKGAAVPASDQFSLAAVMYRGLTGRRPFRALEIVGLIRQILSETAERASAVRPEMPKAIDEVLRRGMAKYPGDRYATCSDFAEALADAFAGRERLWRRLTKSMPFR